MQKKYILFVSTMEAPWGGSEELWSRTALRLVEQGIPVIASVHGCPRLDRRIIDLSNAGVDVRPRPIKPSLIAAARYRVFGKAYIVREVEKALGRISPSLIIISEGGAFPPIELLEWCVAKRCPFAAVMQANFEDWWPMDEVASRYRKAFKMARRCFFVSNANRALAEKQLGYEFENAEVVRNPAVIKTEVPIHWPMAKGLRMACVGRLAPPQKGQDILLEALARQRWAGRNWHLTLYGDGPYREGLERLIRRLNLSDRVTLAGHVAAEQIWLENHVLVMPSRFEGMPLTIIEAMLCGRPVVATNVAGHSEVIVDGITGFMAEAATAQSLDMALERMWAHRDGLDKMGKAAVASVHKFAPVDPVVVFTEKIKKLADLASATR